MMILILASIISLANAQQLYPGEGCRRDEAFTCCYFHGYNNFFEPCMVLPATYQYHSPPTANIKATNYMLHEHSTPHYTLYDFKNHPHWGLISAYSEDCGHSVTDRIIGGVNASLGQYPWIARLGYSYELDSDALTVDTYECGGAIINDRYILSAAHCSPEQLGIKLLQIRLGEHYTETDPDCVNGVCAPPVQDIDVEEYICHKEYTKKNFHNDICLIRLAKPIKFNDYIQPICLPVHDTFHTQNMEKTILDVAGWGIYDIALGKPHTILQTLKVPITSHQLCKLAYVGKADIVDSQLCAGGVIGQDSCGGDSGGPLMGPFAINAPPKYYVVGIVSFGPRKCAETNTPGVYTKVSYYMKWILDNIQP